MKKVLFIVALLFASQLGYAQSFKFGIKLGVGTTTASLKNTLEVPVAGSGSSTFTFDEGNTNVDFHAGFAGRVTVANFYVQPELYFSSVNSGLTFSDGLNTTKVTQTMTRLDIPVLAGLKFGKIIRVQAGPIASLALKKDSGVAAQLAGKLGVEVLEDSGTFVFGYQAGVGADVGSRLSIDVKYESNLSWFGSSVVVDNKSYDFDMRSRQVLVSLGLWF